MVKRDKGYYITGRGCGLLTPLKYMKEVPDNLDENTCSYIPFKDRVEFNCNGCKRGNRKVEMIGGLLHVTQVGRPLAMGDTWPKEPLLGCPS